MGVIFLKLMVILSGGIFQSLDSYILGYQSGLETSYIRNLVKNNISYAYLLNRNNVKLLSYRIGSKSGIFVAKKEPVIAQSGVLSGATYAMFRNIDTERTLKLTALADGDVEVIGYNRDHILITENVSIVGGVGISTNSFVHLTTLTSLSSSLDGETVKTVGHNQFFIGYFGSKYVIEAIIDSNGDNIIRNLIRNDLVEITMGNYNVYTFNYY